jgi:HD-GYP domain-containing protein (c-di-GMP phosphodiesterase class II)
LASYNEAWSTDEGFRELRKRADDTLDRDCIEALIKHRAQVEEVRQHFRENPYA